MPRRRAVDLTTFDAHVQPSLQRAFPLAEAPDRSFEEMLGERLTALARVFDTGASHGRAAVAANPKASEDGRRAA